MGQRVINVGYHQYLASPGWRKKRAERLEHDGFKCARCRSDEQLQVHHRSYDRLGDEQIEDLETLCRTCHMHEHCKDPTLPPFMPDSYYSGLWWERQVLLAKQEEIALAAGVDLTQWLTQAAPWQTVEINMDDYR